MSERIGRSIFFLVGAAFSAGIGYLGMWLATRANVRVAAAANATAGGRRPCGSRSAPAAPSAWPPPASACSAPPRSSSSTSADAPKILEGFGFGAAMLAMFMRVGGGIFTKAADVGADLVGKVEQGIPEDDPRNAATIADNVGDNVGDCAGMAADLFESYAVTLVASLILGSAAFGAKGLVFPLIVPAIGVLTAIIGVYITKAKAGESGLVTINRSFYISAVISAVLCAVAAFVYLPNNFRELDVDGRRRRSRQPGRHRDQSRCSSASCWPPSSCGSPATSPAPTTSRPRTSRRARSPVRPPSSWPASRSASSPPSTPRWSSVPPCSARSCCPARLIVSLFVIALAGCGLLTTVGVIVAMDTFGPVSDNAQGVAEMSGEVTEEGAKILTELDAVGNTTKAITKGIAIATAVLAATALFGSYSDAIAGAALARSAGEHGRS